MLHKFALVAVGFVVGGAAFMWWVSSNGSASSPFGASSATHALVSQARPTRDSEGMVREGMVREGIVRPRAGTNTPISTIAVTNLPRSFAEISAMTSEFEQSMYLYQMLNGRTTQELLELLDEADIFRGEDYRAATSIIFGRLAELDPELALTEALSRQSPLRTTWITAIFHSWARIDLEAAIIKAETLPLSTKQFAARAIAGSRNDLDMQQQIDLASRLDVQVPTAVADGDFAGAWEHANSISDRSTRMQTLMALATKWASIDPAQALIAAQSIGSMSVRSSIEQRVVSRWAEDDPQAAIDWILHQESSPRLGNLVQGIVSRIAQSDLQQAKAIANSLTGVERDSATLGLVARWAVDDLDAATEWMTNLESPQMRNQAVRTIALGLVQAGDIGRVDEWMLSLTNQETDSANMLVNSILVNTDPDLAAQRVEAMRSGPSRDSMTTSLVQQWAQRDPAQAARWIESQNVPNEAYQSLLQSWTRWSPIDALAYARNLRDDDQRDYALMGVLSFPSSDDVEAILDEFVDPNLRNRAAQQAYRRLSRSDPQRAQALSESLGLNANNR